MMPENETPQHTEGYQGFYHLSGATMSVAKSELKYICVTLRRSVYKLAKH